MILIINTAAENKITIGRASDDGDLILGQVFSCHFEQAEKLLPAIDAFFKKSKDNKKDLKGIIVVAGPGGFTALRVGVITANTLAYALKIPVVSVRLTEFNDLKTLAKMGWKELNRVRKKSVVLPYYGKPPHITKPKKKIW